MATSGKRAWVRSSAMAGRKVLPDRNPGVPDDRVLLITGASTGIGAATARSAVGAGWSVVLAARSEDKLRGLAGELGEERALVKRCDVTEFADQEALVEAALERVGRIEA